MRQSWHSKQAVTPYVDTTTKTIMSSLEPSTVLDADLNKTVSVRSAGHRRKRARGPYWASSRPSDDPSRESVDNALLLLGSPGPERRVLALVEAAE